MRLQKGFSLVELLVVIAIIGLLSSIGTVGFQRYIDISQTSVGLQNFNTFSRFLSTELLLLNNNIKEQSSDIKAGNVLWRKDTHNLDSFLNGVASFHDLDSDLGGFKNPFGGSDKKQIYSTSNLNDPDKSSLTNQGNIVLRVHPSSPLDGAKIAGPRKFQVLYYIKNGVFDTTMISSYVLE